MSKFQHLTRAILSRPWAIDPDSVAWAAIVDVLAMRASGERLTDQEIEARIAAAGNGPRAGGARNRNVAVIPIYGVISPRQNMMVKASGGVTAESIRDEFRAALADPEVDGIVFDVDSPGGVVEGIDELAAEIRGARGQKPIAAVANHLAASAAYWAIAGVDEIVATPSASVGSIGIFTAHQDVSEAMAKEGVVTTLISAGKYKVERSQYAPLAEEARAAVQEEVDAWYGTMTSSIGKSRGISAAKVVSQYGEGRTLRANLALERGMVDRIDSLENTIKRVARGTVGRKPTAVATDTGPYIVGIDLARDGAEDETVLVTDAAGATVSFVTRIRAATAEVRSIGAEARKRTELRAAEGRSPSPATVLALNELMGTAEELPVETVPLPDPEESGDQAEPGDPPATEAKRPRRDLELLEAAYRGGYSLPS